MWIDYNPNPQGRRVGDCAVRALCKALNIPWEQAFTTIYVQGFSMADMPSSNAVWGAELKRHGFVRKIIPDVCHDCYTVIDFCADHPDGVFVVGLSGHVVTVVDGNYYDSWDSGHEIPIYYYEKRK